jgi:predicted 2-oxoglutarate/Fe(II)-dependent dioxygenase YbiX
MVMNKKELAPGIVVYSDVIENHTSLISDIEEGMVSARREWAQSSIKSNDTIKVDTDYRDTLTSVVPYTNSIIDDFINLDQAFNATLSNIFLLGFQPAEEDYKSEYQLNTIWHDSYSILKYGEGQKFVNHIDDHQDLHRRLSLVYYINDDYKGGEIVFPRFNITYKPNANELLLFPSTYVYNHSVSQVIEGTRYAVVSWLT